MSDFSLLDLFREEVTGCTQVLNDGLVALEQTPANIQLIEPLMRAAHSIKGAARVVAVDPAVKVAHAMEECLVKAQKGELVLASAAIDVLLRGVDMLSQMAVAVGPEFGAWETAHSPAIAELLQRLAAVQKVEPAPPVVLAVEAPAAPKPEPLPRGPTARPAASIQTRRRRCRGACRPRDRPKPDSPDGVGRRIAGRSSSGWLQPLRRFTVAAKRAAGPGLQPMI